MRQKIVWIGENIAPYTCLAGLFVALVGDLLLGAKNPTGLVLAIFGLAIIAASAVFIYAVPEDTDDN